MKAIEICKRNELWNLIKKVSEYHQGDDAEWLKEYAREMLKTHTLDEALACFRDLASHAVPKTKEMIHQAGVEPPKEIQYQAPFIKNNY